jgi:hypothetical protein
MKVPIICASGDEKISMMYFSPYRTMSAEGCIRTSKSLGIMCAEPNIGVDSEASLSFQRTEGRISIK